MPPKNSKKICICPECKKEIKPIVKYIENVKNISEKNILSFFEYENNNIEYTYFLDSSFYIKTVQSCAIRVLLQSLSKCFDEIILKINEKGIHFLKVSDNNILFHLKLDCNQLEYYIINKKDYCESDESDESDELNENIYLNFNLKEMKHILKQIKNDDILCFQKNEKCDFWELNIQNYEKNKSSSYKFFNKINTIEEIEIISKLFNCNLNIPFSLIDDTIKKMDILEPKDISVIINEDSYLRFFCEKEDKTQSCENKILFNETNHIDNSFRIIIKNKYDFEKFKTVKLFIDLCMCVNIFINQEDIIILNINVANLGTLKICIPPIDN
jgi:hypothetical protein